MRRAARVVFSLLFSYLVQATILPYFRVGSIILDVITVVLFTAGFACGMYAGFLAGLMGALLLEVLSGDLPGLSALFAVLTGLFGAYVTIWMSRAQQDDGKKRREGLTKRIVPAAAVFGLVSVRELIFVAYFYLTGAEISVTHVIRMFRCALLAGALAFLLVPALSGFMTRDPKKTFIANWKRRRRNRKLPKRFGPTIDLTKENPLDAMAANLGRFETEPPSAPYSEYSGITEIAPGDPDATLGESGATPQDPGANPASESGTEAE